MPQKLVKPFPIYQKGHFLYLWQEGHMATYGCLAKPMLAPPLPLSVSHVPAKHFVAWPFSPQISTLLIVHTYACAHTHNHMYTYTGYFSLFPLLPSSLSLSPLSLASLLLVLAMSRLLLFLSALHSFRCLRTLSLFYSQ